ncbi:hypothetical protein [Mangrovimonas sp. TPBH4]|uniref:hypothetical protein n=1 Tax=Mangrovimonas sp. TPBH4 TaxID=1645914 RepID=UPI0006B5A0EC|nr:hypothetical protein [Mangrovimonas sp. TPBH4]
MKQILLLSIILSLAMSCSSKKQVERAINTGNYNQAITEALRKLETNKNSKRKQDYAMMLQEAFHKAQERDLNTIKHLKKDNNPELYTEIYELYNYLNKRQEAIKPILPLVVEDKTITFKFQDYSNAISEWKNKTADYLYEKGLALLESNYKADIREAHNVLSYVERIHPNYEDTRELLLEAHERGIEHVIVNIKNNTNQVIPRQLEQDLLNFDTYGLNQFWLAYHSNRISGLQYDFAMELQLQLINISPEQIKERQIPREQEIVDGWQYQLDQNGNVMKDSLGNDIKVDKIIKVKADLFEFQQFKSSQILGNAVFSDLKTQQTISTLPVDSGFIFEHFYATYRGDKRALTKDDLKLTRNQAIPFPSNEQMVFDTGEDLKLRLKDILASFKIDNQTAAPRY